MATYNDEVQGIELTRMQESTHHIGTRSYQPNHAQFHLISFSVLAARRLLA
jgi:hypothetical protein